MLYRARNDREERKMYTYKDFEDKVKEYGFTDGQISDADYRLAQYNPDAGVALLGYKNDWLTATNDSAKAMAHAAAEDIRTRYGNYSGGGNGGSFTPTGTEEYEDPWETAIQSTIRSLNNRKFEWSPETDPTVKYYEDAYRREGERAMKDTLGAVAATTGGIPSSYATAAAAQQRNYYAQQMTDKYPELYQQAFERFMKEYDNEYNMLSAYADLSEQGYGRWSDTQERNRNARLDAAAAVQQAFNNQTKLDELAQGNRQLDITENQYGAQNAIAWEKLGLAREELDLAREDMLKGYDLAYAELNQNDRHFIDEMLYNYKVFEAGNEQFWAELAQNKEISDANLKLAYDQLSQSGKEFLQTLAFNYAELAQEDQHHQDTMDYNRDVLAQEDQHHQDNIRLTEAEIQLRYDQLDAETKESIRDRAYDYAVLAEEARQWDAQAEITMAEIGLERDQLNQSASVQELETAFAAAEFGDFSYLRRLGIDASTYEAIWNMQANEAMNPTVYGTGGGEGTETAGTGTEKDAGNGGTSVTEGSFVGPVKTGAEFTKIEDIIGKANAGFELTDNEKAILAGQDVTSNSEFTNINDIIAKASKGIKLTEREKKIFDKYTAKMLAK